MKDILVMDVETKTFGKPDRTKDRMRIFGCYSYKTDKTYLLTKKEDVQKMIDNHKFLVGFNNREYDNPIIEREGISLRNKIIIDLFAIIKSRASSMKVKKGMLGDLLIHYSLDFITKTLGLADEKNGKKDIDYKIFQKDVWTSDEKKEIVEYTKRDIEITKKLYDWIEDYFSSFKDFLKEGDIEKKVYLTCTTAVFAYKAICKKLRLQEEYDTMQRLETFGGGYVAYPAGEKFTNNMGLFDYSSLYPNMFIQANLFGDKCSCCELHEKWHGDNFFNVEGYYCSKELSKLGKLFQEFFLMRKEMKKKNDPREYSIKIIINSSYGAISNPSFKNIYNLTAAKDCTSLGRQIIKYTRKRFREEGYLNIMSDTDSVLVRYPEGKTKEDAQELANEIVKEVQSHLPFSW